VGARKAPKWKRRWLAWRNRKLADPVMQRRLAAFPLTAPIARQRASHLFDLVAGFTYSQILQAAVESGLIDLLARAPARIDAIAETTGLSEGAALRLIRGAEALDLLEAVDEGEWTLGQQGAALAGNPGAQAMIRHHRLLYADLAEPLALLNDDRASATALSTFWTYDGERRADEAAAYSQLMATSQAMVAEQVLAAYPVQRHRRLLDVGGGYGAFARAVLDHAPRMDVGIFDLPSVLAGLPADIGARVAPHPGDFFRDPIPQGYDLVTLVRILHDHDDGPALAVLRAIRASLPMGGRLLLAEPMAGTPGAKRMGDAYFGLYLWAMRSGRPRTADENLALLESAGFRNARIMPTRQPVICSLIVAEA
jgi:demethylspheroidene O-methyltransferase